MSSHAGTFGDAFSDLNRRLGTNTEEVGMKYLTAAVRRFFAVVREGTPSFDSQTRTVWDCVKGSGLAEAWKVVGDSERHARLLSGEGKKGRMKEVDA